MVQRTELGHTGPTHHSGAMLQLSALQPNSKGRLLLDTHTPGTHTLTLTLTLSLSLTLTLTYSSHAGKKGDHAKQGQ